MTPPVQWTGGVAVSYFVSEKTTYKLTNTNNWLYYNKIRLQCKAGYSADKNKRAQ